MESEVGTVMRIYVPIELVLTDDFPLESYDKNSTIKFSLDATKSLASSGLESK
jgi:hypothetical protein